MNPSLNIPNPTSSNSANQIAGIVKFWLIIGLLMIFFQVVLGGITRLTGSGLSITKWEIVTGTVPPMSQAGWETEFDLYKVTPQYEKINQGMTIGEFKFIYFWEYFHRLWARSIGFVFLFPFIIFVRKKMLPKPLIKDLGIVVLLTAVVASMGWIMVASGLNDRPWVNAYKLTLHLSTALLAFSYMFWTILKVFQPKVPVIHNGSLKRLSLLLIIVLAIQIFIGGIMSGMKAGLAYPSWPDMSGEFIPNILFNSSHWTWQSFVDYDKNSFMPALIQTTHRLLAYLLTIIILVFFVKGLKVRSSSIFRKGNFVLLSMLVIQVLLGILTVINCLGKIPLTLGVLHQAGALLLLMATLFIVYQLWRKSY